MKMMPLAMLLITLDSDGAMTSLHPGPQLIGETVNVSYVANPSVGHGEFRLHNSGANAVTAAVHSVWLELGGRHKPIADVTVFDLDHDQTLNPTGFTVEAGVTMRFLAGFPVVAHEPRFGEKTAVGLQLKVNGAVLQAVSPVVFVRRIPLGP